MLYHPILAVRSRLIGWSLIWLLITIVHFVISNVYLNQLEVAVVDSLVFNSVLALLGLGVWYPFRFMGDTSGNQSLIANHLLAAIISLLIWMGLSMFILKSIYPGNAEYLQALNKSFPWRIAFGTMLYSVNILTYYVIIYYENLTKRKVREQELEKLVRETELQMLRSQINPHFLFNSLNSISSLTITDPEKARSMVIKLSDIMRYSLSRKNDQPVTLENELEHLRLYLDVEKVRFGDKLHYTEEVDPDCVEKHIPNMLLQPLYENAVKHGVYESTQKVRLKTEVRCIGTEVYIAISNNYDPDRIPAKGTGTGLRNIKRRLHLFYGRSDLINVIDQDARFRVELRLPEIIKTP